MSVVCYRTTFLQISSNPLHLSQSLCLWVSPSVVFVNTNLTKFCNWPTCVRLSFQGPCQQPSTFLLLLSLLCQTACGSRGCGQREMVTYMHVLPLFPSSAFYIYRIVRASALKIAVMTPHWQSWKVVVAPHSDQQYLLLPLQLPIRLQTALWNCRLQNMA